MFKLKLWTELAIAFQLILAFMNVEIARLGMKIVNFIGPVYFHTFSAIVCLISAVIIISLSVDMKKEG